MKNQVIRSIAILGLFFVLAVASVKAQSTPSSIEVNIPFDFSAGGLMLKAGAYRVTKTNLGALTIRSEDGKMSAFVHAPMTIESRDYKAGARVVFNRYDDRYFVSQVWLMPGTGIQLLASGAERRLARELAKTKTKPETREVVARKIR